MKRVLLLNNIPAPYFDPLFAKLGDERDWSLRVCYTSVWNANAGWVEKPMDEARYRTIVLDREHPMLTRWFGSSFSAAVSLISEMWRDRPDYLISYGYTLFPQYAAIIWSALTGTPVAIIGDANIHADGTRGLRRLIKRMWLERVVSRAAALIAIGTANRQFWERYGARKEQLFEAKYAVDNERFSREVEGERERASQLRAELGVTASVVFLFVGRLVKRKNVDLIVKAMNQLKGRDLALLVVGDGEERVALEALAAGDRRVRFVGAVPQRDLARYYALADVLVLPARDEPWGLVINEAMAAGLAVIAHEHCGAAVDLVGADNGFVLQSWSIEELASALERIAVDDKMRERMRACSQQKIKEWSIEGAARGIIDAVMRSSGSNLRSAPTVGEVE